MIDLKEIAETLKGANYWEKGNLKRVYLDRGNNTQKTSTKVFVFKNENGDLKVSCKVNCPSQSRQWEQSQENMLKEKVYDEISSVIS